MLDKTRWTFFRVAVVGVVSMLNLTGCAIGNKHNYRDVVATIPDVSGQDVSVSTHDRRPYVLSGDKTPNFVGIQRGGYGNPFDVTVADNQSLSSSFSTAACNSLKAAGAACGVVETNYTESPSQVVSNARHAGRPRALIFTLREWKTDTMLNTALHYDFTLDVINSNGQVLASRTLKGVDDLRGSFWNAPGYAKKAAPEGFKRKLQDVLGSEEVRAVLGNGGSKPQSMIASAAVSKNCSVSQILEMKKIGLSQEQIEKSCD